MGSAWWNAQRPRPADHARRLGAAKIVALAVTCGIGIALVWANAPSWELEDMNAYWDAGNRLRDGLQLYPAVADPGAADVFRYAPWFAWLWIPLTYLPKAAVQVGWSAILLGSIPIAVAPILRRRSVATICVAALMGGLLFKTASTGNVHPLLIAALVHGVTRRSGPIWVGIAASLKIAPIAYALVYAGRREWKRAGLAALVALLLFAPALLYDLRAYPAQPGDSLSLLSTLGPVPWAAFAGLAVLVAFGLARTRHAWVAGSLAVLALIPRLDFYNLTYLLVGLDAPSSPRGEGLPAEPSR